MATIVKNLKLSDSVIKSGDALPGALTVGSKSYDGTSNVAVDASDLGLSTAYVPKGSISVAAAATALAAASVGWVYNVSDSGTIAGGVGGGSFKVKAGDNIVVVEEDVSGTATKRWDKLSATVAQYTGSGAVTVTEVEAGPNTIGVNVGSNIKEETDGGGTTSLVVSLDKAGNVGSGSGQVANLDGKTLRDIIGLLGGTVSQN